MAKIDTTKIEGYAEMTAEEKLSALENYAFPDPDYSGFVKKEVFDKASHDAAEWKRKHNALIGEEEAKKQEREEQFAEMQERISQLESEKKQSAHKAAFLSMGYDEQSASEAAAALISGNTEVFFETQQKFLSDYAKNLRADAVRNTPRPNKSGTVEIDYSKKIQEARAAGDNSAVAYWTRREQQDGSDE